MNNYENLEENSDNIYDRNDDIMCNTMTAMATPLYEATIVGIDSALMREEPAEESESVSEVPSNAPEKIRNHYQDDNFAAFDYVNVTYNNKSGWVNKDYLEGSGEEIF